MRQKSDTEKEFNVKVTIIVEGNNPEEAISHVYQMMDDYYKHYIDTTHIVGYEINDGGYKPKE